MDARDADAHWHDVVMQIEDYAIITLDPDGVIRTWNRGAQRLKGYAAEEALGRGFEMFYPEADRREGLPTALLLAARDGGRVQHTGWRVRRDGTRFWGDVVITALHAPDGALTGFAKVTRDRTDVKTLEQAQDAFYAAFEHDFRTPLTALRGYLDALLDARPEDRARLVARADANVERLLDLVESLVDFARQRSDHGRLAMTQVDLHQAARGAVEDVAGDLGPHRVRIGPGRVLARASWVAMHRVVTNLVVNALKYSHPDTTVWVDLEADGDLALLRVRDRGRGIDPRDLDSICAQFERGRLAEEDGGTGLGLASASDLVRQQAGQLRIESEVGVGTAVTVTLPRWRRLAQDPAGPGQAPAGQPSG